MRKLSVAGAFAVVVVCMLSPVGAQDPGDVGSVECGQAQLEAKDLVAEGQPFKNHGQMMRAINELLNPKIRDGVISGGCAGCIRSQFAKKIPPDEQVPCGEDPAATAIKIFASDTFERIRLVVDPADGSPSVAKFVGSHIEVASDAWVFVLDITGNQIFRPKVAALHMREAFEEEIEPDVDTWALQRVPEGTVSLAQEIAFAAFEAKYVFDPDTVVVPVRELITSKATEWEMVRSYEGRTSVLFRPASLSADLVESFDTSFSTNAKGEPVVTTRSVEIPSQSYETAVTFAPAGHVMRVESGFLTSAGREALGVYQEAVEDGRIIPGQMLYDQNIRFGGFFSPEEPRLELTAYSYESESFLNLMMLSCEDPVDCNPFWPYNDYDYCYNSPWAPDVNTYIRPSLKYRFQTFNIWHEYGRRGGIRGNWRPLIQSWEVPNVTIQVHASLQDYPMVDPPWREQSTETCEGFFDFEFSTGNKLEQLFYDDLESCHVAMINTHGGPIQSDRIGRETFQFLRSYDQWATLHEIGDDGLGVGRLRHLFLETCSTMNWRNHYRDDPKTLASDFMNSHIADGVRTIGGFDGGRWGGQVTGWRFFGHYHAGESISQSWIAMGLEEYDCNMPIMVAYGEDEEDAASVLFDGRFSTVRGRTGWAMAVEPVTERHLEPRACCIATSAGPSCVELTHSECDAEGGQPLDCGNTCEEFGEKCQ